MKPLHSSVVLSHGIICFLAIYKMKFGSFYFAPCGSDRDLKQVSSFSLACVNFTVIRSTLLKTGMFRTDSKGVFQRLKLATVDEQAQIRPVLKKE